MKKYEKDYAKVEALRKRYPKKTTRELLEQAGVNPSSYYHCKKAAEGKLKPRMPKKDKAPRYAVLEAAAVAPVVDKKSERLVFMMGTPEQIRAVLAGGAL